MRFFKFKTSATWLATWFSVATMVMTPVAQGQEAQNISKQQMQNVFDQLGLNKKTTVGQFFEKNKALFPERVRKEIEPVLANYKNVMMPEFRFTMAKGPGGRDIPNIAMTYNGQLINMQWFGEKERFVKFQNTNLSEIDVINFTDMFSRVLNHDAYLRKQNEVAQTQLNAPTTKFSSLPVLSPETWKKMTMQDRVSYMIQIRHMYLEAQNVLIEKNKSSKNKKSASFEFLENMWSIFAGIEAEAATAAPKKPTVKARLNKHSQPMLSGSSCVVAGYSVNYVNGICDHKALKNQYSDDSLVSVASKECSQSGQIACNPLIYGMPRDGHPVCITPSTQKGGEFQIATHFGGPCDRESLLQKDPSAVKFLNDDKKKVGRYDSENLSMSDEARREYFKNQQAPNYDETQKFIEGVLKSKFPGVKDFFVDGKMNESYLAEIKRVQELFDQEIGQSKELCKAAANDKTANHEKNFYGACDQLHRRFLFTAELLAKQCKDGSTINPDSLLCVCPAKNEVVPGSRCIPPAPVPTTPPAPPVEPPVKDKPAPPICPPGTTPETITGKLSGAEETTCVPDKTKPDKPKDDCGVLCSVWKGIKFIAPVAIGLGVAYLIYKTLIPKKVTLNAAADVCPNGTKAPCVGSCSNTYQVWNSATSSCACAACGPGQAITVAATCTCGSGGGTVTGTYTCWDGTTKVSDLSLCPAQEYTCWNGTKVTNALNCPEQTTTTTPTTTNPTKTSPATGR